MEGSAAALPQPERKSFWQKLWRHRLTRVGLLIVSSLIVIAVLAGPLSPHDPKFQFDGGLSELGEPHRPAAPFYLGADNLGRDVLSRVIHGAQISLTVAFCAMLTAVLIGTTVGLLGGYLGGWVDVVLTRLTEMVMSLPAILLAIALFMVLPGETSSQRFMKLLIAISLVTWTTIARAVRGLVLSLKEREYIEAARAAGSSQWKIIWRHLLPNVMPTVLVLATLATASNILLEAGLSYLGQGVDPSTPSWGGMIRDGQPFMISAPWIIMAPGVAIVLAVTGFNLLGRGLEETLETRTREK